MYVPGDGRVWKFWGNTGIGVGLFGTVCTDALVTEGAHAWAIGNLGSMCTVRPIMKTKPDQTNLKYIAMRDTGIFSTKTTESRSKEKRAMGGVLVWGVC